jgi:hypothetical protein
MTANSFSEAVKQALAKKQEQHHPKAKKNQQQRQKNPAAPVVNGAPIRKASGRGG